MGKKTLRPSNKQIPFPKTIDEMLHYQWVLSTEVFETEQYELDRRKHEYTKIWIEYNRKVKELFE